MQVGMDFDALMDRLAQRLSQPLPGAEAHDLLRATPIGVLKPVFEHKLPPKPGSVLMLLYPAENSIKFPLTKRTDYLGAHGGQISLPGGKSEPGESYLETALRECEEEIGVSRQAVTMIGRLSDFFVIPSNFMVVPVIGAIHERPRYIADPVEVDRILEGDLYDLIRNDAVKRKEIVAAKQYRMMAPHFEIDDEIIWGATAMILNELRTILREII